MRTISCKLEDLKTMTLHIGYEGENDYTSVRIDAGSVFAQYPEAVPSLKVQPPKGNMYPVIVTRDGDIVIWNVSDSDTASNGNGEIQLTFTENTVVVKSCTGKTLVHRSLKATGTAPDPLIDFIDRAEEVVGEAQDAAEAAEAAAQHAPMIGLDGYWYTWSKDAGEYVKTDTKAQGEDGQQGPAGKDGADGAPGQDGHTPVKGTDYWTQQDQADIVAAAALETVSAVIDDTAGDGDTNKTWSADKISETTGQLLTAIHGISDGGKLLDVDVKTALINLFDHVAFTDDKAQVYINALKTAWEPSATLSSITAVFTQGSAVINIGDSIDTLKQYLVVTGNYTADGYTFTDEVVGYTLSGTLEAGESTITVTYKNKTTTFTVYVESLLPSGYQQVEYVGATAQDQYILFDDIHVLSKNELSKYTFDIDFCFDEWNSAGGNSNIVAGFSSDAGLWLGYNNTVSNIAMGTASGCYFTDNNPTARHKYEFTFNKNLGSHGKSIILRDDDNSISREALAEYFTENSTFVLFSATSGQSGSGRNSNFDFIGKIYSFSMTYGGQPLMNLVPCYRKSDNEIGFYDTVGEAFYTNSGNGTFTKGGNV